MSSTASQVTIAEVKEAHKQLIEVERHRNAGELSQAQDLCHKLLDIHPDYVGALTTLSVMHMHTGAFAAAFPHLVRATMLNPKDWALLTNLGRVYLELGANGRAARVLDKASKLSPYQPAPHYYLGRALIEQQHYDRAIDCLERAQKMDTENSLIPIRLSECYLQQGRHSAAAAALKTALELSPGRTSAAYIYRMASNLPEEVEFDLDILTKIEALGDPQPDEGESTVADLAFARASCLERLGRHEEAWDCLVAANAPLKKKYEVPAQIHAENTKELLSICLNWSRRDKKPAKGADKTPASLYILGISRSGKTSMENLVGTLPGVEMRREHDLATATAQYVSQRAGLLTTYSLCQLPGELDSVVADTYRARLKKCAGDAGLVTITHPGAISDAGRVAECAPNTKFIFMTRNDDDLAFRIFGQYYQENKNEYAYDLNAIYNYIANNRIMIDNWLEKLGNQAMAVRYEDMVKDAKSTLARVAKFCGLEPSSKLNLQIGDDSGCSVPYREWLHAARDGTSTT